MEDHLFTGRDRELQFFCDMLEGRRSTQVLAIRGMGGIGKTGLLKQFQRLADEVGIAWAQIDETTSEDVPRILGEIARQLARHGVKLSPLRGKLRQYARIKAQLPSPTRAMLTSVADLVGGAASLVPGMLPGVGSAAQQLAGSIYDVLKRSDAELYLDAPRYLTEQLRRSLQKVEQPLLIFFDAYERMLDLDPWVRQLAGLVREQGGWLVIAGQVQLGTRWRDLPGVKTLTLRSLTLRDSRRFLRRRGLTDRADIEAIARFCSGVPLALQLASELALNYDIRDFGSAPEKQQIVDQILERAAQVASPEEMEVLTACAIPRALNVTLIKRLLPERNARAIMADLRQRPYALFRAEGLALHDSVRQFALARLQFEDGERFGELQQAAIDYYDGRLAAMEQRRRKRSRDWHDLARERLYHTVHLNEDQGYDYFQGLYWQSDKRFQFDECLNLANTFLQFDFRDRQYRHLGHWHKGHALFDLNRWEEAKEIYLSILDAHVEPKWLSFTLNELGKTCTALSQWEEARGYLERSVVLKRQMGDQYGLGIALMRLGEVHSYLHTDLGYREIRLFREALAIFEREKRLFRQADASHRLSHSHCTMGNWEDAGHYAQAALDLCQEDEQGEYQATFRRARTLVVRTHIHRHQGRFRQAEDDARQALALFRDLEHEYRIADALQSLAHVLILRGNLDEATACLDEAMPLAEKMDDRFFMPIIDKTYGQIHLRQGRLDQARAIFQRYLEAMTGLQEPLRVALAHHLLGEVSFQREAWAEAAGHFRRAIGYFYNESSAAFRATETLRLMGLVLVRSGHRPAGLRLLQFALREAEERGVLHVQARASVSLAEVLGQDPQPDRKAIRGHLRVAGRLAREQGYEEVSAQVARLR